MRALEERVFTFMQRSKRKLVRKMRPALMPCAEYIDYTGYDRVSFDYDRTGNSAYGADHCKLYADLHFGSAELGKFHGGKVGPALGDCVGHQLVKAVSAVTSYLQEHGASIFNTTIGVTTSVFVGLFNFILGFVFAIYLLMQKEKIGEQFKRLLYAYIKKERVDKFLSVMSLAQNVYSRFVTGQLTEALIIGVLCFIGMLIFSMPYATLISTLIAFTALIPMIGAFIGTAIGRAAYLNGGSDQGFMVCGIYYRTTAI